MAPTVRRLERQPSGETTVHKKLESIVRRIASRLTSQNGTEPWANAVCVNQITTDAVRIKPGGLSDLLSGAREDVIIGDAAPPDVPSLVPYVRGFHHGVLKKLVRDSEVILPALGRAEVSADRLERGIYT